MSVTQNQLRSAIAHTLGRKLFEALGSKTTPEILKMAIVHAFVYKHSDIDLSMDEVEVLRETQINLDNKGSMSLANDKLVYLAREREGHVVDRNTVFLADDGRTIRFGSPDEGDPNEAWFVSQPDGTVDGADQFLEKLIKRHGFFLGW